MTVARLVCGVVHKHCYLLIVEQRHLFLRCAICGKESDGITVD